MNTPRFCAVLFAAIVMFASPASANIVVNGGFETGDFTGWTLGGNTDFVLTTEDPTYVHSGLWAAALGSDGSLGTLSQDLITSAGTSYFLSFWLYGNGATPNEFAVSVGGNTLFDTIDLNLSAYTKFTYEFTATAPTTTLTFSSRNDNDYFGLDDVSVNAVPEPASLQLLAMSVGAGLLVSQKRRVAWIVARVTPGALCRRPFCRQKYTV